MIAMIVKSSLLHWYGWYNPYNNSSKSNLRSSGSLFDEPVWYEDTTKISI